MRNWGRLKTTRVKCKPYAYSLLKANMVRIVNGVIFILIHLSDLAFECWIICILFVYPSFYLLQAVDLWKQTRSIRFLSDGMCLSKQGMTKIERKINDYIPYLRIANVIKSGGGHFTFITERKEDSRCGVVFELL